ncbi:hypothetical protein NTR1_96 [Nocardia phage NTR1]|nr:hypothetical protein NTR1_96 [Nocardia phage NTR1]
MADPFASARDVGDLFEASYDSDLDCGHYVHAGDLIAYVEGELSCEECREEALA